MEMPGFKKLLSAIYNDYSKQKTKEKLEKKISYHAGPLRWSFFLWTS